MKPKAKSTKPASTYKLGWFTLRWNCIERESLKDAASKKMQCKDITTSARFRTFLGKAAKKLSGNLDV